MSKTRTWKDAMKGAAEAYEQYQRDLKKTHRIRVRDLRILRMLVPEDTPTFKALEEDAPKYVCTCGESFDTLEEANHHREEALKDEDNVRNQMG